MARVGAGRVLVFELPATVLARRAAVHGCDIAGLSRHHLRAELLRSGRAIRRRAHEPVAPAVLRGIRLRISLEQASRAVICAA